MFVPEQIISNGLYKNKMIMAGKNDFSAKLCNKK